MILSKRTIFYQSRNLKVFLADLITCDHIVHLTALSLNFYGKQKVWNIIIFQTWFRHKNVIPSRRFSIPQKLRIRFFQNFFFHIHRSSSKLQLCYRQFFYDTYSWAKFVNSLDVTQRSMPFLVIPSRTYIWIIRTPTKTWNPMELLACIEARGLHNLWTYSALSDVFTFGYWIIKAKKRDFVTLGQTAK
jgi:hypothetical protein